VHAPILAGLQSNFGLESSGIHHVRGTTLTATTRGSWRGRRRVARRRGLLALITVSALTGLTACGSTGTTAPLGFEVANNFTPNGVALPLYAADALGYFADEGLDVTVSSLRSSQDALNALDTGRADLAVTSAILNIGNAAQGVATVSVGNALGRHSYGLMVDKTRGIRTLKDLEGKQVLASAGFIIDEAKSALAKSGVDVSKVGFATVAPSAILSTYVGGQGDAWLTSVPLGQAAVMTARPSDTFLLADLGFTMPDYAYTVRPKQLTDQGERSKIDKFLSAVYRAQDAAVADPEGVTAKVASKYAEINASTAAAQWRSTIPFICSTNTPVGESQAYQPPTDWTTAADILAEIGYAKEKVDASTLFTNDFANSTPTTCPIAGVARP
jgi:ABC-type nitrate/sulfonate/bicarbonate transport system substrate-binding protein